MPVETPSGPEGAPSSEKLGPPGLGGQCEEEDDDDDDDDDDDEVLELAVMTQMAVCQDQKSVLGARRGNQ